MYLNRKDIPEVIINNINYNGTKFELRVTEQVTLSNTAWSGGSKRTYTAINLSTGEQAQCAMVIGGLVGTRPQTIDIPNGVAVLEHCIFGGKDMGYRIYVNQNTAAPLLPESNDIAELEKVVLALTVGYKSFARLEYAQRAGITKQMWEDTKATLIEKKLLKKNGAISVEGRNVVGDYRVSYSYKYQG